MKSARDPRHLQRIDRVKALYSYSFAGVGDPLIEEITEQLDQIDSRIAGVATERAVSEIAKIDLAILRLGVFELQQGLKPSIAIDEAVEIAKLYGTDTSAKFVNGVLSKLAESV